MNNVRGAWAQPAYWSGTGWVRPFWFSWATSALFQRLSLSLCCLWLIYDGASVEGKDLWKPTQKNAPPVLFPATDASAFLPLRNESQHRSARSFMKDSSKSVCPDASAAVSNVNDFLRSPAYQFNNFQHYNYDYY